MDLRIVSDLAGLEGLGEAWRAIEHSQPHLPHTCTHEYVCAWARARGSRAELAIVVAEDQGELVGVLPLGIRRRQRGPVTIRELGFLAEGDHLDAIVDATRVSSSTIVKGLLSTAFAQPQAQRIALRYLPDRSPLTHYLLRSGEYNESTRPLIEVPRLQLDAYESFAQYRRTVPRSVITSANKLRREHGMTVQVTSPVPEDLFTELAELHRRLQQVLVSRAGRVNRRSLFNDAERASAYRELTVDRSAGVAFTARNSAGELLFYELAWRRGDTIATWNTAYNPDHASSRPSRARLDVIEGMFRDGDVRVFDFGAGRYPWKFELTPAFDMRYEFTTWRGDGALPRVLRRWRP